MPQWTTPTTINTNDNTLEPQNTFAINNMDNSKVEKNVPYDQFSSDSLLSILYDQSVFNSINYNNNSNSNSNSNINSHSGTFPNESNPNVLDDSFNVIDKTDLSKHLLTPTFEDFLSPRSQSPQNSTNMKTNISELANSNNTTVMTNKFSNKYLDPVPNPNFIINNNNNTNINNTNTNINNQGIPFTLQEDEEPTTNLDDLIKDITSDTNSNNIINDNDLFLNNAFFNIDNGIRRHSDAFLTNNTAVPSNMSTSRASISHQFDMWTGLQSNSNKNSNSLRKVASLNNSSNNMLLRTKSNRQLGTNTLKPSGKFNSNFINFIDPFNNNNNNNNSNSDNNNNNKSNSSEFIRPPLKRAVTSVKSTDNIHLISSPSNERTYSVRKNPYRGSVPTIDINILKELSASAGITPLSKVSPSNDRFYNNLDDSLSSNNLVPVTAPASETVSLSNDVSNNLSELAKSNPPSTESSYPSENTSIQRNDVPIISPYSDGNSNNSNNNNYDHSYLSLPQKTIRSASVADLYSSVEKSTQTLPVNTVTPLPVKYLNMSNDACMEKISPLNMNQQQQIMAPSQMNQNANQCPMPQMLPFIPPSKSVTNGNNDLSLEQHRVMNLPIQPIPQNASMPSKNKISNVEPHSRNPPGYRRTSITIVQTNKKKNQATNSCKEKAYQCEYCEKSFKRAEHKKRHVRSIHTQERPFSCQLCNKKFSRSDNLQQHLKVHKKHELEEIKKIQLNILKDPSFR